MNRTLLRPVDYDIAISTPCADYARVRELAGRLSGDNSSAAATSHSRDMAKPLPPSCCAPTSTPARAR